MERGSGAKFVLETGDDRLIRWYMPEDRVYYLSLQVYRPLHA